MQAAAGALRAADEESLGAPKMFYGLVEFEVCDPDGYRICVGGEVPPGADVKLHQERSERDA